MDPTTFATLRTAKLSNDLTALLSILEPPEKAEKSQINKVLQLLERIAEEPDSNRAAHGRARIRTRRALRGFEAAVAPRAGHLAELTRRLATAPTASGLALDALRGDDARLVSVFSTEPHPDPRGRDPKAVSSDLADQVLARQTDIETRAAVAVKLAALARTQLGLLDRMSGLLGVPTQAAREAAGAAAEAERLQIEVENNRDGLREEIRSADARAPLIVQSRRREHDAWSTRPLVAAALEQSRLNVAVAAAVRSGDPQITALAASGDVAGAREEVLMREHYARQQREERLRQEMTQRMDGYQPTERQPGGRGAGGTWRR